MKTGLRQYTNMLPLAAAIALPAVLGACSGSSSPPPPPAPTTLPVATLAGDVSANEGDSGTRNITFTVQLDKNADGPVTVNYATADGTATAGTDYVAATGSTTISPAQTSKTIDVTVNGDIQFEADETLTLSITSVSSNVTLGSASSATGTITNDDAAPLVLFIADREIDDDNELWMYSVDTGGPVKVNGALTTAGTRGDVTSFAMSPNRQWIAYVADQDTDDQFELYVRDAALANPAVKVSRPTPAAGSDVSDNPVWAPDSSRIAYRNDQDSAGTFNLTTVTPGGGGRANVVPAGTGPGNVVQGSYVWAPDGSRIAFLADVNTASLNELYSSPPADSIGSVRVNALLTAGQEITDHVWAPDSSAIAYRANQGTNGEYELYVGSPTTANSGSAVGGTSGTTDGNVQANSISWAPDSSRLAFIAHLTAADINEIYTVQPTGSGRTRVNSNLTGNKDIIGTPSWAPDSSRIAYIGDVLQENDFELFTSQPAVADTSTKVSGTLTNNTDVETEPGDNLAPPAWSPDSASLIYVADQNNAGEREVYVGAADGSGSATGNTKVSGATMLGNATISGDGESWSPDGTRILYRADQDVLGTVALWTSTASGGSNTKLTEPTPADTTPLSGSDKWSPESSYVAYAADQDTSGVIELFIATPAGIRTKISGAMVSGGDVDPATFVWAP